MASLAARASPTQCGAAPVPRAARRSARAQNRRRSAAAPPPVRAAVTADVEAPPKPAPPPVYDISEAEICDTGVRMVRCKTKDRLKFEVEYGMKKGTTDNSYLLKGERASALIDLPDRTFAQDFANAERSAVDFIILGHLSPKRIDSLAALLMARDPSLPPVEVCCSNPAAQIIYTALKPGTPASSDSLTEAWKGPNGLRARLRTLRTGDTLDLGGDRVLEFTAAPTPRWPDLIVSFDPQSKLLFTSKLFSAHVATDGATDSGGGGWEVFGEDWRYFFDCMLAPMARPAQSALSKLDSVIGIDVSGVGSSVVSNDAKPVPKSVAPGLQKFLRGVASNQLYKNFKRSGGKKKMLSRALCPAHGPAVESSKAELAREYGVWVNEQVAAADNTSVAVIYASAYGNTSAMAQAVARGITKGGVAVEMLNCELSPPDEVEELLSRVDGFCLGAPTIGGHIPTPVATALGVIVKEADRDSPCGVFGSFGWSGEAVDIMEGRLKDAAFSFAFDAIRCKFKPTEETLQVCEESGTDLAQRVRKKARKKQLDAQKKLSTLTERAAASDTAAAVGHIVGSLCAVTTRNGDAQSAMLASWVSQASFNPPALTVAVAKDRAVESFMLTGGKFNLNVLKLGEERDTMKALLKPFKPGENRFGDLEVELSENNGCAIVTKGCLSYVECEVTQRMEAGDHWIVLANVTEGKLMDDTGLTAIHHRSTGSSY